MNTNIKSLPKLFIYTMLTIRRIVNEILSTKVYSLVLISVMLIGIFGLTYALNDQVHITSTGQIATGRVIARSGSSADIQAAVDAVAAAGGGEVIIPAGTFDFVIDPNKKGIDNLPAGVIIPGGVNVFGAGADQTILRQPTDPPYNSAMFLIDGVNGKPVRISGIKFDGYVAATTTGEDTNNRAITVFGTKDFRIDHCVFEDFSNTGILSKKDSATLIHKGVIDHCDFGNPYKDTMPYGTFYWGYGIIVVGTSYNWEPDISNLLGKYVDNVVFIEDNVFSRCRHAIASNAGGYYVARHNNFTRPRPYNFHHIDVHGTSGAAPAVGGRGLEAYDNIIEDEWDPNNNKFVGWGFGIRGGGGVVFNHTIYNCSIGIWMANDGGTQQEKCKNNDMYLWNNQIVGGGTPLTTGADVIENVNYFLYARPNYTPYSYPHPLTLEAYP